MIRSYVAEEYDPLSEVCNILEAARATSAASTLFPPIKIGPAGQEFVDGALGHNNPNRKADRESRGEWQNMRKKKTRAYRKPRLTWDQYIELWPDDDRLLISVGTGAAPGPDASGDLPDLCKAIAKLITETEKTNEDFRDSHRDMIEKSRLFRFNVQQGLAGVGLDEHEHMGAISAHTMTYLKMWDTRREFDRCVSAMADSILVGEG